MMPATERGHTMSAEAISEDSSKNKRKRGRPKSFASDFADNLGAFLEGDKGSRTRMNAAYRQIWISVALHQEPEITLEIFRATKEELQTGAKKMPSGWETEGEAIGRALIAGAVEEEEAVEIVLNARRNNVAAGRIAAHFRKIRLGEKKGNSISLLTALARTLDKYLAQFPATTEQQRIAAIENLLDFAKNPPEEAA